MLSLIDSVQVTPVGHTHFFIAVAKCRLSPLTLSVIRRVVVSRCESWCSSTWSVVAPVQAVKSDCGEVMLRLT